MKCQCRLRPLGESYWRVFVVLLIPLYFESEGAVRKSSVGAVRRETFLDMVSIVDKSRRFTSRLIVCLLLTRVEGEC